MNTVKKLIFATLIVGSTVPAIQAYSWTPKTIAAVTLAGLGFGTAATIKYYGFNSITNAVLEKCANAKNWFSSKISDAVYGSYKNQMHLLSLSHTLHLEQVKEEAKQKSTQQEDQIKEATRRAQESAQQAKNVSTARRLTAIELVSKIKKAHDAHVSLKKDHAQLKADVRRLLDEYNINLTNLINNMPHLPQATAEYLASLEKPVEEEVASQE